jgi:hypothetical protein
MGSRKATSPLEAIKPSRRGFLLGAAAIASVPLIQACELPGFGPTVEMFGRPGSFGGLAGRSKVPTGQSFATAPVKNWGFGPGQSAYMSAVMQDGTVVVATTPYTDNQLQPTGTSMEICYLQPAQRNFRRMAIPTSTGARSVSGPGSAFGGADIGDLQVIGSGASERLMFCSAAPYHGWNVNRYGQFPSFGSLRRSGAGGFQLTSAHTADQLARQPRAAAMMPAYTNGFGQSVHNSRGFCEMARLPRSGHMVISQYFGDANLAEGGIVVVDSSGRVHASYQYPAIKYNGLSIRCGVREVESDPSSKYGDERFVVVCDAVDPNNRTVRFPVQEFSYDARNARITPTSVPVQASADATRMETAKYGLDGTLYVARTKANGLSSDRVAVYRRGTLARRAPARAGWATNGFNTVVTPDQFVNGSEATTLVRSMAVDPKTGAILTTGMSGTLQALTGAVGRVRVSAEVSLGLDLLANRSTHTIGVRKGSIDSARRALWIPIPQLATAGADQSYPWPRVPHLDQWMARVDLSRVVGS